MQSGWGTLTQGKSLYFGRMAVTHQRKPPQKKDFSEGNGKALLEVTCAKCLRVLLRFLRNGQPFGIFFPQSLLLDTAHLVYVLCAYEILDVHILTTRSLRQDILL